MQVSTPPDAVLKAAGLENAALRVIPWEAPLWRFELSTGPAVLRVKKWRPEQSLRWELDLLTGLDGRFDDSSGAMAFRRLANDLPAHVEDETEWLPIHGDFTVDNVLVDPNSRQCSGIIDFEMAQLAPRVADLAWSAWRSARTHRNALTLDKDRLRRLVTGYARSSETPFDPDELLDWLIVRGLLWVAIVGGPGQASHLARIALERVLWIEHNRTALRVAVSL